MLFENSLHIKCRSGVGFGIGRCCSAGLASQKAGPHPTSPAQVCALCSALLLAGKNFASVPHVTYFMHGKQVLSSMAEHRRTLATEVNCIVLQSQHERAAEMLCM